MTQQKVTTMVYDITQSLYQEIKKFKYTKELLISACLLIGAILSFLSYKMYVVYREQKAQRIFGQYITEYHQVKNGSSTDWQRLANLFEQGSKEQSNSYLSPYFILFQVDALVKEGKRQEALAGLDTVIQQATSSPLLTLIKTKRALILLDDVDEIARTRGLEELKELAEDKKNQFRDTAQFYLGQYYWSVNSIEQAEDVWQTLKDEQYKEKLAASPWLELTKTR